MVKSHRGDFQPPHRGGWKSLVWLSTVVLPHREPAPGAVVASPSRSSMSCALGGIVRGAIDGQATNLSLNFAIDKFNAKFCHLARSDP